MSSLRLCSVTFDLSGPAFAGWRIGAGRLVAHFLAGIVLFVVHGTALAILPSAVSPSPLLPPEYSADGSDVESVQLEILRRLAAAWKRGDWEQAVLYCQTMVAQYPADRLSWKCLIDTGVKASYFGDAIVGFEELAKRNDPLLATHEFQHNFGHTLASLQRPGDAVRAYQRAVAIDPKQKITWHDLALAYLSLGRYGDAILAAEQALALDPAYAEAWGVRGKAYLGLRQHRQAVLSLEKAVRLDPVAGKGGKEELWFMLGDVYVVTGQVDMARQALYVLERLGSRHSGVLRQSIKERENNEWIKRHED